MSTMKQFLSRLPVLAVRIAPVSVRNSAPDRIEFCSLSSRVREL